MSAVSKKLMPPAIDVLTSSSAPAWPTAPMALKNPLPSPHVMVPKQSFKPGSPVLPSVAYSMAFSFHVSPLCRALSRRRRACRHWLIAVPSTMIKISYSGYRFPPEIIQHAIWLYIRFTLSFRDVEDLLAERGIMVSYETVRRWVTHFGPMVAADLRKRRPKPHTTWHLDEVYLKIDGRMVYLWRAVDAEGEVLDGHCHIIGNCMRWTFHFAISCRGDDFAPRLHG